MNKNKANFIFLLSALIFSFGCNSEDEKNELPECEPRCDGNILYLCEEQPDGSMHEKMLNCGFGCQNNACVPPEASTCHPGCQDGHIWVECAANQQKITKECISGCDEFGCLETDPPCEYTHCEGNVLLVCKENGEYEEQPCNYGCQNNACNESPTECISGCSGNDLIQCAPDGTREVTHCENGCQSGACNRPTEDECAPVCNGKFLYYCDESGNQKTDYCNFGCENSACVEIYCEGNKLIRHGAVDEVDDCTEHGEICITDEHGYADCEEACPGTGERQSICKVEDGKTSTTYYECSRQENGWLAISSQDTIHNGILNKEIDCSKGCSGDGTHCKGKTDSEYAICDPQSWIPKCEGESILYCDNYYGYIKAQDCAADGKICVMANGIPQCRKRCSQKDENSVCVPTDGYGKTSALKKGCFEDENNKLYEENSEIACRNGCNDDRTDCKKFSDDEYQTCYGKTNDKGLVFTERCDDDKAVYCTSSSSEKGSVKVLNCENSGNICGFYKGSNNCFEPCTQENELFISYCYNSNYAYAKQCRKLDDGRLAIVEEYTSCGRGCNYALNACNAEESCTNSDTRCEDNKVYYCLGPSDHRYMTVEDCSAYDGYSCMEIAGNPKCTKKCDQVNSFSQRCEGNVRVKERCTQQYSNFPYINRESLTCAYGCDPQKGDCYDLPQINPDETCSEVTYQKKCINNALIYCKEGKVAYSLCNEGCSSFSSENVAGCLNSCENIGKNVKCEEAWEAGKGTVYRVVETTCALSDEHNLRQYNRVLEYCPYKCNAEGTGCRDINPPVNEGDPCEAGSTPKQCINGLMITCSSDGKYIYDLNNCNPEHYKPEYHMGESCDPDTFERICQNGVYTSCTNNTIRVDDLGQTRGCVMDDGELVVTYKANSGETNYPGELSISYIDPCIQRDYFKSDKYTLTYNEYVEYEGLLYSLSRYAESICIGNERYYCGPETSNHKWHSENCEKGCSFDNEQKTAVCNE